MSWANSASLIEDYIFRIETPSGFGTGFLFMYGLGGAQIGIATAYHVVEHEDKWSVPIKITHHKTGKSMLLSASDRVITHAGDLDSAAIICRKDELELPEKLLPMMDRKQHLRVGSEIAWMGFPDLASEHLCFFKGSVSAFIHSEKSYLVDGVAINGVSGGPVFTTKQDVTLILGSISAYFPNQTPDGLLPGLLKAYDITLFSISAEQFKIAEDNAREQILAKMAKDRDTESPP